MADTPLAAAQPREKYFGLSLAAWFQIVTIAVLMCALFRFNLVRLWGKTNPINGQDSNWQHSVFVPLIGLYYLYIHRDELLKARVRMTWSGLPILLMGILLFLYGIYPGQNDYIKDFGMVVTLFGTVAFLCGWQVMKIAWFPIAFLVVALPWPELVYSKFAWPLQKLAASVAVGTLRAVGIEATNFGTKIAIFGSKPGEPPRILNVAEACAGLRSLMTFVMVAGTVAFLSSRAMWERMVITLSAIPIAIFCNVLRVSGQGILDHWKGPEWSEGFAHQFVGLIMLIPGFFLIMLVGWILDKLFIEEVDRGSLKLASASGPAVGLPRRTPETPKKPEAPASAVAAGAERIAPAAERVAAPAVPNVDVNPSTTSPAARMTAPPATLKSASKPPAAPAQSAPPSSVAQSSGLLPSPVKSKTAATAPQSTGLKASPLKPSNQSNPPAKPGASASSGLKPSAPKARPPVQGPGLLKSPTAKPQAAAPASKPAAPLTEPGKPATTPPVIPGKRPAGSQPPSNPSNQTPGGSK